MQDGIADPNQIGDFSAAVGVEFYDLTSDGLLDGDDLTEMLDNILGTALGDFNLDGLVNGDDLTAWQDDYGTLYDGGDFLDWQVNLGFSNMALAALQAASATVPEPASALLLSLALGYASLGRRRRRC